LKTFLFRCQLRATTKYGTRGETYVAMLGEARRGGVGIVIVPQTLPAGVQGIHHAVFRGKHLNAARSVATCGGKRNWQGA